MALVDCRARSALGVGQSSYNPFQHRVAVLKLGQGEALVGFVAVLRHVAGTDDECRVAEV